MIMITVILMMKGMIIKQKLKNETAIMKVLLACVVTKAIIIEFIKLLVIIIMIIAVIIVIYKIL